MARTAAEHVVMMQVDYVRPVEPEAVESDAPETPGTVESDIAAYSSVESDAPETPEAVGPEAEYAYVPVMGVDGKGAGLAWIKQHGTEGETYRVASFSTGPFKVGQVEKTIVKRALIEQ